jgi:hypothetical protein
MDFPLAPVKRAGRSILVEAAVERIAQAVGRA